jgi:hypothetical protein
MATGSWPTIIDVALRTDPQGRMGDIAEMLSQSNDYAEDMPMVEANEKTGHEFIFRTSIPAGTWRQYNMGVPYSKSTTAKARVGIGMLEDYSQVDRALAEHSGDMMGFRESEDVAFLEGMSQTIAQTTFYGNTVATPAEFMGLTPFYNTLNVANAQNAANVMSGGGAGNNNASLWLVGWGTKSIYGIYPHGSKAGLSMEDKGDVTPGFDNAGNRFEAYTSWFRQQMGIVPQDWRYAVRLANLDTTTGTNGLASNNPPDLFTMMASMVMRFPKFTPPTSGITRTDAPRDDITVRAVFYANRTVRQWMDIQAMRDRNVLLTLNDYAGKPITTYRGIPIKIVDQLLNTETLVS